MNLKRYLLPLAAFMAVSTGAVAQQPYGGCWHPDDIKDWSPETDPNAKFNRSRVPLAERFREPELMKATATQWYEGQITNATILFQTCSACPSQGANNFLGYQPTYWQYMDKLVYWAGSASEGIIIPPPAPSIDAAHQAGVKALGQVFFPPGPYGGESIWVTQMLTKENGEFVYARKLYEIAKYLGFDGWFINEETWHGKNPEWADFVKDFNRIADENGDTWFEIQWYDAKPVLKTDVLKAHKNTSQFLEYGHVGSNLEAASELDCTPEETFSKLYSGIECVREGLVGYGGALASAFGPNGHVGSVALFCPEEHAWKDIVKDMLGLNDTGADAYAAITRVFKSEEDVWVNLASDPSAAPGSYWRGISSHVLERSAITSMPFVSNMCVGVGKYRFVDGVKHGTQDWYHSGVQSVLPTWRFWIENRGDIEVSIDWDDAYNHGSSFKFAGTLSGEALVRLYKTMIPVTDGGIVRVVFKGGLAPELKLSTTSSVNPDVTLKAKTSEKNGWTIAEYDLASLNGKTIYMIGLNLKGSGAIDMNLGQIAVLPAGYAPAATEISNFKVEANLGEEKGDIRLTWDFDWSDDFDHFDIYTQNLSGTRTLVGQTRGEAFYIPTMMRNGTDSRIDVQIVPVMKDMVQGAPVNGSAYYPEATTPVVSFKLSKSFIKVGETATVTAVGTGAPFAWQWTLPESLELVSGELTDNVITVKALSEGHQKVTLSSTNTVGTSITSRDILDVYTEENCPKEDYPYDNSVNVIEKKAVVKFSQSANTSEMPSNIIDGVRYPKSKSEKWCATTPGPNWAIFDLRGVYRIYGFGIWDCKSGPEQNENFADYTIELSLDGENWTTVVNEEGRGLDNIKYDYIAPTYGRYVRLSPNNDGVLRIWEFEVYGVDEGTISATIDRTDLSLMSGDTEYLTVTYDLRDFERHEDFKCEAVVENEIVKIGKITEDAAACTFTIPVTALDAIGETEVVITVRNGGVYAETRVHILVDSDSYPNLVAGRTAVMRHYKGDYTPSTEYDSYTSDKLSDGDTTTDACLDIENFSTHTDDFHIIFEADVRWNVSKIDVYLPNGNKGENDNGTQGFVNKNISVAIGNDLNALKVVKTFSDLTEVNDKLSCILPMADDCRYVVVMCNLNPYFYPSVAEVEVFGENDESEREMVSEPVVISNWRDDVIAESRPSALSTTTTLDDSGWVFYSSGIQDAGALAGADRTLVSAKGTKFVLAPYDEPNAYVLKKKYEDCTINFATPSYCEELQLLVLSANGNTKVDVRLNYDDGTMTARKTYSVYNWGVSSSSAAKSGLGRIITKKSVGHSSDEIDDSGVNVMEIAVPADINRKVKSIFVEAQEPGRYPTILAVSRTGYKGIQSGIEDIADNGDDAEIEAIYNLQGIRVSDNTLPGVYVVRYTDGSVRKVIVK